MFVCLFVTYFDIIYNGIARGSRRGRMRKGGIEKTILVGKGKKLEEREKLRKRYIAGRLFCEYFATPDRYDYSIDNKIATFVKYYS